MSKLYYPTPDELVIGNSNILAEPITEVKWFRLHQDLLVLLANTHEGRELLCIDSWKDMPFPVIGITKNEVRFDASKEFGPRTCISDFRVGAKWGNVIRWRWQAVKKALDRINLKYLLSLPKFVVYEGRKLPILCGAATSTTYPDAHPETNTCDGITLAIAFNGATWSTLRGLSAYWAGATGETMYWGYASVYGQALGPWQSMKRCFFFFDTSSIGADSTISAGTVSLYVYYLSGAWGGGGTEHTWGVFAKSGTSSQTDIGTGDTLGTTLQAPSLGYASTTDDATHSFVLNSTGRAHISKTGITKFGARGANYDAANVEPSNPSTYPGYSTEIHIRTSERTGTSYDPKLVVTYTLPSLAAVTGEIGNGATEQAVRSAT